MNPPGAWSTVTWSEAISAMVYLHAETFAAYGF
jgi:hypothetical protein